MGQFNHNSWPEFHQVAIHVPEENHLKARAFLSMTGNDEWYEDRALLVGEMWDPYEWDYVKRNVRGHMSFNYQMLGNRELEILSYIGASHHTLSGVATRNATGFISHMSTHVEDAEDFGAHLAAKHDVRIVHRFDTFNHENPHVAGNRRFREVVLGTRHILGFDLKLIQRLTEGPWTYEEEGDNLDTR